MIIRNSALCLECHTEVISQHRHDFVRCKCGAVAVDGGQAYLKRSIIPGKQFKDTSIVTEEENDESD